MVPPPRAAVNRLRLPVASPSDTKTLIETAVNRFLEEVPALQPLKLVAGLELRGGRDVQIYRVELPGPKVSKDLPADDIAPGPIALLHGQHALAAAEVLVPEPHLFSLRARLQQASEAVGVFDRGDGFIALWQRDV